MRVHQEPWFSKIIHPSRYLGGEINSIQKDPRSVDVSIALAFPDIYEIGMSHVGLKILYHILNSQNWLSAERVFAPWVDLQAELQERNIPLSSLESGRPLSEFDILGFSLQHELCYTNVLAMLDLAGIPLLSQERDLSDPLIIAGGPACFNPEPVAGIFDAMVIGDGEEAAVSVCQIVREWKREKTKSRFELLKELTRIRGVYVPSFFEVRYDPKGTVYQVEPLLEGYVRVEKAIVRDLNQHPFPSKHVVPFTELVHDRFTVEIARGCSRGCRFCQAGMIYRPVRERHPHEIVRVAEAGLAETGFDDLSLLSLSSGDYTNVVPLLKEVMARFAKAHVAVSFSSLRVDSAISSFMKEIKRVRKTSFTIAPEAGSQRLRDIINKGLTDDQILTTVREIYAGGWNLIKLYFMIGLPSETEDDLAAIVELSKKISRLAPQGRKKNVVNVSVAPFVPKTHTPFQWVPQLDLEECKRRINLIRDGLRSHRIRVKWNKPEASWLEGIFARGDRRLTEVVVDAWRRGAHFDSWSEHLNVELWKEVLESHRLDPASFLYRQRDSAEILPWDHINTGISKEFLLKEWHRALKGVTTPDCREQCPACGVCEDLKVAPVLFELQEPLGERTATQPRETTIAIQRFRLTYTKLKKTRYLSQLELMRLFIRAFRRAGIELAYSEGYHPMPKLSFALALPVGIESLGETMDVSVRSSSAALLTSDRLNRELPSGISVLLVEEKPLNTPHPQVKEGHFHIKTNTAFSKENLDRFLKASAFRAVKKHRNGEREVDLRVQVKELGLVSEDEVKLVVRHGGGPQMKPAEIIREIFAFSEKQMEGMTILKTKSILAAES